ncbi:NAD-dependent epimerase/dehydratase family protein [Acetobacterium bakii]|uniref:NAD-dependent epimerase/dehydratase domain-containing protein n=1 Tax=Acetobacterium bakii TaxID=52689 RepID=A0A0L6U0J9_9FIRM|nr:NAD(P)-dependent oxidoreductase [Acetobacterium bakii]KNZ42039.1 hypothetical protein AKG39_08895 [Acetobacterium bakii]
MKRVLVTGSNGLLGKQVVDALLRENFEVTGIATGDTSECRDPRFNYISADLTNWLKVDAIFKENEFSHVIHLAGIAHVLKGMNISWSRYYRVNTMMSRKIFECASAEKTPIFFASTVDVYGFTDDIINESTKPKPIGDYARSKYLAEQSILELPDQPYLIARFAPIYSEEDRHDMRRRYYLRFPELCYLIGDGMDYEFLSSKNAAALIVKWVKSWETISGIVNVCDEKRHNTKALIQADRENGWANMVLWMPRWIKGLARVSVDMAFYKKPLLKFSAYKIICPMQIDRSRLNSLL